MAKTDYRFDNIHVDLDYEVLFEAIKKYCRREEVPFRVDSDFIDDRGFNLDISRKSSFIANEASGKIHIVGYKSEPKEIEGETAGADGETAEETATATTAGTDLTFQCNSGEQTREKAEELIVNRILNGVNRILDDKSVEEMLAESRAAGTQSMKDIIGEGKEKRNFIITAIVGILIIAFIAPDACNHGWF